MWFRFEHNTITIEADPLSLPLPLPLHFSTMAIDTTRQDCGNMCGVLILVVAALALAVGLGVGLGDPNLRASSPSTFNSTMSPTSAPLNLTSCALFTTCSIGSDDVQQWTCPDSLGCSPLPGFINSKNGAQCGACNLAPTGTVLCVSYCA